MVDEPQLIRKALHPLARAWRPAASVASIAVLAACASLPPKGDAPDSGELLRNSLPVAAAALAAGQADVAHRLYLSLAERYADAPGPLLGLGYTALYGGEFAAARSRFLQAAERAGDRPALRSEARLAAGRAALAEGRIAEAERILRSARGPARGTPSEPWVANGLGVVASLEADYQVADTRFREALALSPEDPRITANLVQMLLAAGRVDDAARLHAARDPSWWVDDDGRTLARLIEESRPRPFADAPATFGRAAPPVPDIASEPLPPAGAREAEAAPEDSDRSLPAVLVLSLGQSRRLHVDVDTTAISVASPEVADVQLLSPNVLYVIGKGIGRTSIALLVGNELSEERVVSVVLDLDPLRTHLGDDPELSGVRARPRGRGVVLSGEVASPETADRALRLAATILPEGVPIDNELRIRGPQQVNLEVQIAEVQRSVTEDLGVNWEAFQIRGPQVFGFRVGRLATVPIAAPIANRIQNPFPQFPLSPEPLWLQLSTAPFIFAPANFDGEISSTFAFGRQTANTRIGAMIDALATAGLANVLARPNVTAVSGESASFFSGGEFPLPSGFDNGTLTFEYKKYGVLLDFVPTVVDAGRIVLKVRPEVSEPSLNQALEVVAGINVPVINVRRAETTVEVGDGESIVIAGLFRSASNTRESGVPGLKDVPLLGALFGQTSSRSNELELIVIVTARLVQANAAPDGSGVPPTDRQLSGYRY